MRQLFWECTLRCTLSCRHCGSDCKASCLQKDMPFEDFAKVLDSVRAHTDPHLVQVIFSGGEPLCRADLEQCGVKVRSLGFPWGIVTNAWGLTPARFSSLLKAGMGAMTVSIDGLREEHDWMRGRAGSFERASSAAEMACKYIREGNPLQFDVVTCVNRRNVKVLPQLKEHLISLGLSDWRLFTVFPAGRAVSDPEMQLSAGELHSLMEFILATRKEGRIHAGYSCEGFLGEYEGLVRDHFFHCNAGLSVASVRADGGISGCLSIRDDFSQGNIYEDDFWSVWSERFKPFRDRNWMKTGECASCGWWRWCRGGGMHLRDSDGHLLKCAIPRKGPNP